MHAWIKVAGVKFFMNCLIASMDVYRKGFYGTNPLLFLNGRFHSICLSPLTSKNLTEASQLAEANALLTFNSILFC